MSQSAVKISTLFSQPKKFTETNRPGILHATVDSAKILRSSLRFKIYNYKLLQNIITQDEEVCFTFCC